MIILKYDSEKKLLITRDGTPRLEPEDEKTLLATRVYNEIQALFSKFVVTIHYCFPEEELEENFKDFIYVVFHLNPVHKTWKSSTYFDDTFEFQVELFENIDVFRAFLLSKRDSYISELNDLAAKTERIKYGNTQI